MAMGLPIYDVQEHQNDRITPSSPQTPRPPAEPPASPRGSRRIKFPISFSQLKGSVPDLIYRFQQVHQWSLRLVVVTVPDYAEEIEEAIRSYPFSDKLVVLSPQQVIAATSSLDRLLDLRKTIFAS